MTTLYHPAAAVKPSRTFGAGILPPDRPERSEPSEADRLWWAEQTAAQEEAEFHAYLERLAFESAALDRYERGHVTDHDLAAVGAVG